MNPHIIKLLIKGYEEKIKEQDYMAWIQGQYTLSAVMNAIERSFAKHARGKYVEKPILELMEEKEYEKKNDRPEYKGMTEKEKQKAELERAKIYFNSLMARF